MSRARGSRRHPRAGAPRRWARGLLAAAVIAAAGSATFSLASSGSRADVARAGWWSGALPPGFPQPQVPAGNPMNDVKVVVGRRLFYDTRLSGNGTQSCGSCHRQDLAFTDGRTVAVGSTGQAHPRNAQSLVNVVYEATLTWANPALVTLERQMAVPLFGARPVEMGVTDRNKGRVLAQIRSDRWYAQRFPRAFPGLRRPIGWTTIISAIAAFERSIVSADSRYDRYARGELALTAAQARGRTLFMGERAECHHCHGSFIFNDQATYVGAPAETPKFHNTGLYNLGGTGAFPAPNRGLFEITGRPEDMGRFRAPSLRNVALTAPYMHDGSVATLAQAVDHYAAGGRVITQGPHAGDGRRNPYKDPLISAIRLSDRDRADLVAFLTTLTDRRVTTSRRFADPFAASTLARPHDPPSTPERSPSP